MMQSTESRGFNFASPIRDEQSEDEAKTATSRFFQVLLKNPRPGTAFDKVYSFHIDRGSIAALRENLRVAAKLPDSLEPEAGTITGDMVAIDVPNNADAAACGVVFGLIDLKHSESASAIVALQKAIELRPKDPIVHWMLARAFITEQKPDDAIASLEAAIANRPPRMDLLEIYKELARNLQRAQRTDDALNAWKRLESAFPGDLRVKEQIANAVLADGRWDEALTRYRALAEESQDPDQRVNANLAASDVMIQLGRGQEAVTLLESQLEDLDSDGWKFKEIRRRIESIFRNRDDLAGLASYYDAWVKAHPEDVDAMARLARTLSLQNKTAEASDWYRKAIALAPSNASLRESLIEQLVRDNQFTDAMVQYEEMSKFDGGNQDHIEKWGLLIFNQKDVPLADRQGKAAAVWERLLTNRPDDPVTMARLAGLLRRAELSGRAISLYRSAIEKAPNDPQYREYLGEYLHQLQRVDEAVTEWKLMADGDRRNKANLIRLAEVFNRFDQMDLGIAAMRDACMLDPAPLERVQFAEMLRTRSGIRENSPAQEVGRTERSEFRQPAVDTSDAGTRDARSGLQEEFTEALEQLNLAEQSAETPDERQQILKERIQCLVAAGQLEQQIDQLAKELASTTNGADPVVTAERWRTLALYQDAAENTNEATAAAIKVVELQPESIPGWTLLATLYERTGRLGDAADAMKKLASLDRRGISEYLRKTARFQVRLGQFDAALATGRDVIKATPGNPEAYQFFADLAFEVGQPKIAVDSLRQAVRVNPGDEASLKALAKTLADEFQTPEAIELYWRAFEKAPDLESQTQIVVALSNLYLRSNQFPKLIERLELRSRELNLPTEMTRCIATAYREAGDFRKARMTLETLNADGDDAGVLLDLRSLALLEQNATEAAELAKRIESQQPFGSPAQTPLTEQTVLVETDVELLQKIELPIRRIPIEEQIEACRKYLRRHPDDWSVLTALATFLEMSKQHEEAAKIAIRIIQMPIAVNATGTLKEPVNASHGMVRNELLIHTDWVRSELGVPLNHYATAWCRCCAILLLRVESPDAKLLGELLSAENLDRLHDVPAWFMAAHLKAESPILSEFANHLATLRASADWSDERSLIYLLIEQDFRLRFNLAEADLKRTKKQTVVAKLPRIIIDNPTIFQRYPITDCLWQLFRDDPDATRELISELRKTIAVTKDPNSRAIVAALAYVLKDQQLLEASTTGLPKPAMNAPERPFYVAFATITERCGWNHQGITSEPLEKLGLCTTVATLTCEYAPIPGEMLSSIDVPFDRKFGVLEREDTENVSVERLFPKSDLGTVSLLYVNREMRESDEFQEWLNWFDAVPDQLFRSRVNLLLAARQLGNPQFHLVRAAELMPQVPGLRFDVALEAADAKLWPEAIELLDSLSLTETSARIEIESKILEWSLAAGNKERARLAAKRLFGFPINQTQQMQLASRLSQLGLDEELASLNARLGRGAETRQSVLARKLQTYQAQGNDQLAGEVAWELLKLASGGTLFSGTRPNDDQDDGGERLQAIKVLGRLKRLQPLIDRYEAMLEASPESLDLLEILCEFHEAAEQFPQLAEKRDRIALLSKKAPPSLKAKAVALENSGDVSGACDIYLQILNDDPAAFAEEMETYFQAFERAKRQADFLTAVLSLDEYRWSGNASLLINVTAELARAKSQDEVVKRSVEAMLANEETRRLAIGGFLARSDVIAEERLLPAIQEELTLDSAFESYTSTNEVFLILQGVKQESSLKSLRDFVGRTERSEFRQGDDANQTFSDAGTRDARSGLLLVFLNARLGNRAEVEKQLSAMFVDVASGAPSSGLAATFSPAGKKGLGDGGEDLGTVRLMLFAMNARLKDVGTEWVNSRRMILEWMLNQPMEQDDFDSLADSLTASDDAVMEELGAVYELLGDSAKSRNTMNRRIQALISNTITSGEGSSASIRQLLQAGEKIQASGFPIEGTQLLLNVTQHDIDQFTKDLDNDKGIAFKSRFNASLRWSKQQMAAEKIVSWLELQIGRMTNNAEPSTDESQQGAVDLLLELNGVTDPRSRDQEQLKRIRIHSAMLTAIEKQDFSDEQLAKKIDTATAQLLMLKDPQVSLLTVAAAIANKREQAEQLDAICTAIIRRLDNPGEQQGGSTPSPSQQDLRKNRIPSSLRSDDDLNCVLLASVIGSRPNQKDLAARLLQNAQAAAIRNPNTLVRIAVLNECSAVAKRLELQESSVTLQSNIQQAIDSHVRANGLGIEGEIDLAHEIRTRLLKKAIEPAKP